MDPFQSCSDQASSIPFEPEGVDRSNAQEAAHALRPLSDKKVTLSLVGSGMTFARPDGEVPSVWEEAIEQITRGIGVEAHWVTNEAPSSLIERARRAVGAGSDAKVPIFAPWHAVSPTAFQLGQACEAEAGAKWVASYLFDFGPACSAKSGSVDLALMSPCPQVCVSEDAQIGQLPRLSVLAKMMRAAASEGRTNLAVVVRESARATIAARLLGFEPSLNETSFDVEFVSIEEAVMDIQRGAFDWDAVIAMPDLRGILFAMLAEHFDVPGPWPMLWFDRGLRYVTCESFAGASQPSHFDATVLIQALALVAKHSGHHYTAKRLYESWAAVRDNGVVTATRSSSALYVNEIDEAALISRATHDRYSDTRPLPSWKGLACGQSSTCKAERPVHLSLVT